MDAQWQRTKRAGRGRPPKDEPVEEECIDRVNVQSRRLPPPVATFGWLVLATTIDAQTWSDTDIVQADREQTPTVERGFRWIKHPAAMSPVGLEKPERIAALARLTVVGRLVDGFIQRQVRQYVRQHQASIPGNTGETTIPTATVIFASFATVMRVELNLHGETISQLHGWQPHHELICQALGLDNLGDEDMVAQKNNLTMRRGP